MTHEQTLAEVENFHTPKGNRDSDRIADDIVKALECGDCGNPAHFIDEVFKGCCSAGFCENEGYDTIEEWNSYTVNQLKQRARRCREQSKSLLTKALQLESRLWGMGESVL